MCLPYPGDQVPSPTHTRILPLQRETFRNWRFDRDRFRASSTNGVPVP